MESVAKPQQRAGGFRARSAEKQQIALWCASIRMSFPRQSVYYLCASLCFERNQTEQGCRFSSFLSEGLAFLVTFWAMPKSDNMK